MSEQKHNPQRRIIRAKKNKKRVPLDVVSNDGALWSSMYDSMPSGLTINKYDNQPFKAVQTIFQPNLFASNAAIQSFAQISFNASSLDQSSQFAALFDQYRIDMLEVWITPKLTAATNDLNTAYLTVIDFDDSTSLTTYNSGLDYQNCVTSTVYQSQYRRFKPHIAIAGYTGAFGGYTNATAPWIDWSSANVIHYGIKVAMQPTTAVVNFDVTYRVHFSNRNLR
jgi:hypothetical protein